MNLALFKRRREQLGERLPGSLLLFPGANRIPLNIPMNFAPFRQNSHFLWLTGIRQAGAALLGDPDTGRWELFLPAVPPGDEIWHGATPRPEAIAEQAGLQAVHDMDALPERVAALRHGRPIYSPPAPDEAWPARLAALGVEAPAFNGELPREAPNPLADALVDLRIRKTPEEIRAMQAVADLTVRVHRAVMAATRPSTNEAQLRALVEGMFAAAGCRPAYDPIITARGEILHARAGTTELRAGDLLLVDVGAELPSGYCADVTRTFPVSGKFNPRQRAIYDVVHEAHRRAVAGCRPGVRYRDLHLAACRALAEGLLELGILKGDVDACVETDAHALFFPHGLGHLLGMDVHDLEDLGDRAGYAPGWNRSERFGLAWLRMDRVLEAGMAVTIEPGLYFIPALLQDTAVEARHRKHVDFAVARSYLGLGGVRIEDDVVVTAEGHKVLTGGAPRDPGSVESIVGTEPELLGALGGLSPMRL